MFADPQSVTINAVSQSLPAISRGINASTYQKDDTTVKLSISHTYGAKRNRRLVRLDQNKIAADPLISAQNIKYTQGVYLVMDEPITGFSIAERVFLAAALCGWGTASTNANFVKFMGGEN
jgi:hypothetical protein